MWEYETVTTVGLVMCGYCVTRLDFVHSQSLARTRDILRKAKAMIRAG